MKIHVSAFMRSMVFVFAAIAVSSCYRLVPVDEGDGERSSDSDADSHSSSDEDDLEDCSTWDIWYDEQPMSKFDGVDLLIVVDNSGSMFQEQDILSSAVYTLINSLTRPLSPEVDPTWGFSSIQNLRVAIVTSDMGLQWGGGKIGGNATDIPDCDNDPGMNGEFQIAPHHVTAISVASGQIRCQNGGGQCPEGWECNLDNLCMAPNGDTTVSCPGMDDIAETTFHHVNEDLSTQVACIAQQGTLGCGVEQTLEAAVRGLETHEDFMAPEHILAILVVSDEEDCSIRDKGLFETEEWQSGSSGHLNAACNSPDENETFLFPTNAKDIAAITVAHDEASPASLQTYYRRLLNLKDGQAAAVVFVAIVGVPQALEDGPSPCQGDGVALRDNDCMSDAAMQRELQYFETEGTPYQHFRPACTREVSGTTVTEARPGQRFVKTAMEFGANGYVYSICNADWSPAMRGIAAIMARQTAHQCPTSPLNHVLTPKEDCPDCGKARCDLVVALIRAGDAMSDESCPNRLYEGLLEAEAEAYRSRKTVENIMENDQLTRKIVNCPLPKVAVPLDCDSAEDYMAYVDQSKVGWYYCEKKGESFNDVCHDGVSNDDDNGNNIIGDEDDLVDCEDPDCADCTGCGGRGIICDSGCRFNIGVTDAGWDAIIGQYIKVQCLEESELKAHKCRRE